MRKKLQRLLWPFLFLFTFLLTLKSESVLSQCMLFPVSIQEKVSNSTFIIEGEVMDSKSSWNDNHTMIYTLHHIKVYKIFKGASLPEDVYIVTQGGTVSMSMINVSAELNLAVGEQGIFFCHKSDL